MRKARLTVATLCFLFVTQATARAEVARPVVVELFTSQGCASCPAADVLLKKIAAKPNFLPLSFHVTYFDKQGWRDPFATLANTQRQQHYNRMLGIDAAFTPQMVVDGVMSAAGSNPDDVARAIETARKYKAVFPLSVQLNAAGDALDVRVGDNKAPMPKDAVLYEVHFNRKTNTPVSAGENSGKMIENTNNVVAFFALPIASQYLVPLNSFAEDGVAYLLQDAKGRVLGAASYTRP